MKKIIHLPTTVGGNPQGLSRALNKKGLKSESWTMRQNLYGYSADRVLSSNSDGIIMSELKRIMGMGYIFKADIVFFNFGSTLFYSDTINLDGRFSAWKDLALKVYKIYSKLMQRIELSLLRWRKVVILIQYQGDDARQGDYCIRNYEISPAKELLETDYYTSKSDSYKREQINLLDRYCHKIYALNPDLLNVLPQRSEFLPYSHISLNEWKPVKKKEKGSPLRIGHAPTHRGIKGTEIIIDVCNQLKNDGFDFELVLVEGMDNVTARKKFESFDILIDQLLCGWYGGLALECMALGIPVVAYIRKDDLVHLPSEMKNDLPVINATSESLSECLKYLLNMDRKSLDGLSDQSRRYVEKWHDPNVISKRILDDIEEISQEIGK